MPSPAEILAGLTRIANDYLVLAILWHAAVAFALGGLLNRRWRPSRRLGAALLALPTLSVSALAWATGNLFNGSTFLLISLLLAGFAWRLPAEPARRGPTWAVVLGAVFIAYAWVYPHFLESRPLWFYLVGAPMGLVPCPTLKLVLGFGLIAGGFGSLSWSLTAAVAGLAYGLIGMFALGVWLDAGLLVAAGAMAVYAVQVRRSAATDA